MEETWVGSLSWEKIPWRKMATHFRNSCLRNPMGSPWCPKELAQLSAHTHTHTHTPESTLKALQFQKRIADLLMSKSVFLGKQMSWVLAVIRGPVPGLLSLQSHIWTAWRGSPEPEEISRKSLCNSNNYCGPGGRNEIMLAKCFRAGCLSRASRAWAVGTGGDERVAGRGDHGGRRPSAVPRLPPLWAKRRGMAPSQVPALWSPSQVLPSPRHSCLPRVTN